MPQVYDVDASGNPVLTGGSGAGFNPMTVPPLPGTIALRDSLGRLRATAPAPNGTQPFLNDNVVRIADINLGNGGQTIVGASILNATAWRTQRLPGVWYIFSSTSSDAPLSGVTFLVKAQMNPSGNIQLEAMVWGEPANTQYSTAYFRNFYRNDTGLWSGWKSLSEGAFPDNNNTLDLAVPANGTTFTVPADGWIWFSGRTVAANAELSVEYTLGGDLLGESRYYPYGHDAGVFAHMPVFVGTTYKMWYGALTALVLKFFYPRGVV